MLDLNNINLKDLIMRDKIDLEIGYLKQSPCLECESYKENFPNCFETCPTLDKVQTILAAGISSFKG